MKTPPKRVGLKVVPILRPRDLARAKRAKSLRGTGWCFRNYRNTIRRSILRGFRQPTQNLFEREENLLKDYRLALIFPQLPAHKRLGFNGCGRSGRRNRCDADPGSRQECRRRADFGEALGYRSSE